MIRAVSKDFSWNASAHEFSFFFNDTATTEIYTLSLHDALPISHHPRVTPGQLERHDHGALLIHGRSEEHTSELQSRPHLVCRLLLEKNNPSSASSRAWWIKKAPI